MALGCMEHRGACSADNDSGDGAGLMTQVPWGLFKKDIPDLNEASTGSAAPAAGHPTFTASLHSSSPLKCARLSLKLVRLSASAASCDWHDCSRIGVVLLQRNCSAFLGSLAFTPPGPALSMFVVCRVGMLFLPNDDKLASEACQIIEDVVKREGHCKLVGWREVPVDHAVVGRFAKVTQPRIKQVFVEHKDGLTGPGGCPAVPSAGTSSALLGVT